MGRSATGWAWPSLLLANWSMSRLPRCAGPELAETRPELVEGRDQPDSGLVADSENDPAASRRVEQFGRIGVALTVIGFLLSVAGVVTRALAAQRAPWGNMFEFTITAMALFVGAYLILVWRAGLRWLGLPVTLLAAVGNGLAVTVFYVAVAPLVPALHSVWFLIHIVAAAISGAAFTVGGVMSILYLIKKRAEERGDCPRLPRAASGLAQDRRDRLPLPRLRFPVVDLHGCRGSNLGPVRLGTLLGMGPQGDLGPGHLGDLRVLSARSLDGRLARHQGRRDRDHRPRVVLVQLRRDQPVGLGFALLRGNLSWRCSWADHGLCDVFALLLET